MTSSSSSSPIIFSTLLLLLFISTTFAQPSFRPKALLLPITKDQTTLQYTTILNQGTPPVAASVVFDLGGRYPWVDCDKNYVSTTYKFAPFNSVACSRANSYGYRECFFPLRPHNNTCTSLVENTVTRTANEGVVGLDVVSIQSTDGINPGQVVKIRKLIFVCGPTFLLKGLASGTVGMATMGRQELGLPSQFASAFKFDRKFAVCLPSRGKGVAFFGNAPYAFLPRIQISELDVRPKILPILDTTPLLINPVSTATSYIPTEKSTEYFIGVTDIKIGNKSVPINKPLLEINGTTGFGGTKISTVNPYTVMKSSIFKAFTSAFSKKAAKMNITRVASVAPFGVCFSKKNIVVTRVGYNVPKIQFVLNNKNVVWSIYGSNSMVSVREDVICLGFVDGGVKARTSVVIGGFQLENHLLEFDLARNIFGFSSTLLFRRTTCANFNFTSNA